MIRTEFFIAFLTLVILGAAIALLAHTQPEQFEPLPNQQPLATTPTTTPVTETMAEPTVPLAQKIGQLFIVGHWADTPVASTTDRIATHKLGGVIIMTAPDIATTTNDWVATWQSAASTTLFVGVDQEGGVVSRYKNGFTLTSQRDITSTSSAYAVGKTRGEELAALGINMNFAPVLDIAHSSTSFMYKRSFPDRSTSASLANEMIRGLRKAGVTGVAKHFPGHPDTSTDSHFELPTSSTTKAELASFAAPFVELLSTTPPAALMTAHVLFPNIDTEPVTLSQIFLTDYLRTELGYQGIIITDDLSMDAIDEERTIGEAAILALLAGADVVLLSAEPEKVEVAIEAVEAAVSAGQLPETRITESYERVMKLKEETLQD